VAQDVTAPTCASIVAAAVLYRSADAVCDHCLVLKIGASLREIRHAVRALVATDHFQTRTQTCARCLEPSSLILAVAHAPGQRA
jgi:hypothetical protein